MKIWQKLNKNWEKIKKRKYGKNLEMKIGKIV